MMKQKQLGKTVEKDLPLQKNIKPKQELHWQVENILKRLKKKWENLILKQKDILQVMRQGENFG